jgi:PAS domain S-box-containing protein
MTQFLDIRTLSVVMGATVFVLALSMVCYAVSRKTYAGFGAWTIGTILLSLAFFLIALRHVFPGFITIVLSNALIYSALALFYLGFKSFAEKKGKPYLHIAIVLLLSFLLVPYFTYIAPSVNVRISLISFTAALYFLFSTQVLVREIQYDRVKLNKLLAGTLVSLTIFFAFRGIFFLLPGNAIDNYMSTSVIHGVALLATIIFAMLFVAGLMQLNSQMLEGELDREHEALRESEKKFRFAMDASFAGNFMVKDFKISYVNNRMCELFGYAPEDMIGTLSPPDLVVEEDREKVKRNVKRREQNILDPAYEFKGLRKDGTTFHGLVLGNTIASEGEQSIYGTVIDISERKQAEEALRESEEKYRTILESIEDGYYEVDIAGNLTFFNDALCEIYGYSRNELMGMNIRKTTDQETAKRGYEVFKKVNITRKSEKGFEWRITRKDGAKRVVEGSVSLRRDSEGEPIGFRGIVRDISEKQRLEDQLRQAQKMEAIGMLAGRVAHDLNNILGGLVSYPELLLLQLPEDSPLRKSILTIQKSGEKAAAVVQDLLTLARRGVVVTEVVNLNDVIAQYLESPEHEKLQSYHPDVHVEAHLEKESLNISGSSTHLSKTVMNLVSNAAEAMPEGGKLSVSTKNRYVDRPVSGYDDVEEGDYVVLTVSDTGIGISPDDINKIFEPFYTKKKMGRSGTGLGMAVVWGTVKDHNGYIDVRSIEGKGAAFTLYFPVTRNKKPGDKPALSVDLYSGKGESILIVDDVEEQRSIASGMLKELGYSVASVSSGEEAVEYLKSRKVDLLVLDMIMDPGLDGLETYRKILETHPGQKAIIASGFSETDRVKEVLTLGAGAYIKKPFLLEKIGIAVKEELEMGEIL